MNLRTAELPIIHYFCRLMAIYSTEITSEEISSDNPIHQRLLMPYMYIRDKVKGDVLEIGCGEGRGVELLSGLADSFTAVDKIPEVIEKLSGQYPDSTFIRMNLPPLSGLEDNQFDTVVSFQVIEHIRNDKLYLEEIKRVLKPGGRAYITTPNIRKTLTRNPWHIREYQPHELHALAKEIFEDKSWMEVIGGNEKVWQYYEQNKASVKRITRFDFLNLQYRLPSWMLRIPYELLNRMNRNKLEKASGGLAAEITYRDYLHVEDPEEALDLFLIVEK